MPPRNRLDFLTGIDVVEVEPSNASPEPRPHDVNFVLVPPDRQPRVSVGDFQFSVDGRSLGEVRDVRIPGFDVAENPPEAILGGQMSVSLDVKFNEMAPPPLEEICFRMLRHDITIKEVTHHAESYASIAKQPDGSYYVEAGSKAFETIALFSRAIVRAKEEQAKGLMEAKGRLDLAKPRRALQFGEDDLTKKED